ncbi:MAG TPA: phage holin family protein [Actinophytocola sp.]|uniref:phage holin family protein n=1 Tax=Actinophytocola sp. TaxID=1872138 RepID=UPI002DB67310|nr:phage holin family protein [Actinophytocola sp.]HEU5473513.1 phage holin family protein [Actinophytocola sp.]
MLKRLLLHWVLLAVAIGLVAALLPGVHIHGGLLSLLWIAALFALINVTLGTLLRLLTIPLLLLTLGLFTLVINAVIFALTARWSDALSIDNFWWDLLAALCVTVVTAVLHFVFRQPLTPKPNHA